MDANEELILLKEENARLKTLMNLHIDMDNNSLDIKKLIDLEQLKDVFEKFSSLTGYPVGFVKEDTNEVLISTGWTDICNNFHRAYESSASICKDSNAELTQNLKNSQDISLKQCKHGMVDGATPIIIDGEHIANLFSGQVLFEKPDIEEFMRSSKEFGYDTDLYLKALSEVQIASKKKLEDVLKFLSSIAKIITVLGRDKKEFLNLNSQLELKVAQRTAELNTLNETLEKRIEEEIQKSRAKDKQMLIQSKMAQMGETMEMIAHQWRQPLNSISVIASALEMKTSLGILEPKQLNTKLSQITSLTQHLSDTIDDFRTFFKDTNKKELASLDEIIGAVLEIIGASLNHNSITINLKLNSKDEIELFKNEIKHVLLNIIKNAEDALLDKKIKSPYISIYSNGRTIKISDNAGGIPEEIIDNVFEQYTSTKLRKDGSGIGLYMSKIIVEEHCNGSIGVKNTKDGAEFTIEI